MLRTGASPYAINRSPLGGGPIGQGYIPTRRTGAYGGGPAYASGFGSALSSRAAFSGHGGPIPSGRTTVRGGSSYGKTVEGRGRSRHRPDISSALQFGDSSPILSSTTSTPGFTSRPLGVTTPAKVEVTAPEPVKAAEPVAAAVEEVAAAEPAAAAEEPAAADAADAADATEAAAEPAESDEPHIYFRGPMAVPTRVNRPDQPLQGGPAFSASGRPNFGGPPTNPFGNKGAAARGWAGGENRGEFDAYSGGYEWAPPEGLLDNGYNSRAQANQTEVTDKAEMLGVQDNFAREMAAIVDVSRI